MATKCPKCHSENPKTATFCADCGTRLVSHKDISISVTKTLISPVAEGSSVAGKYRIIEKLGEGGMGVVYKAEDTRLKRTVALKFMPSELTRDSEAKERFIREAQAAAALSHPNICTIHEINEEEGKSFIAMEYIEGQSLRERIKKGPLDLPEVLDIVIQAAQGLTAAHKRGIVHRDIKSANIMVMGSGQAKVMDFGIAKVAGAPLITREAMTMGTVAYMSPEQASGEPVDMRTDVWSLGVVLFEMITGQLPFRGENDQSVMYSIVHKPPEPMRKAAPKVSPELERVVEKALEKKPADRYQSMGELLEDLKALAEGMRPVRAKARLFRGRILGIRKPLFLAASAVILAPAILGLLALLSGPGHTEVFDSIAILPVINETGDTAREYFANGLTRELNTELYKVAALTVPPAETILTYKNSDKPPKKIAQELGVKAVVRVSWLQVKNRHRLNYELSDPFQNRVIAADRLEMEEEDIMILQKELARAVISAVKVAVTPAEQALLAGGRKVNPEAYDLLLQAIEFRPDISWEEQYTRAIDRLERAIAIDPEFALAYAWLGLQYWNQGFNFVRNEKEVYPRAKAAVSKALELDPDLGIAHAHMGWVKCTLDWDFAGADEAWKQAMELLPGDLDIQFNYSVYLGQIVGRFDEGIAMLERLKDEPTYQRIWAQKLVMYLLDAKRYDEALETAKNASPWDEANLTLLVMLAEAYASKEMYAEALSIEKKLMESSAAKNEPAFFMASARIQALAGRREEALRSLEKLKELLSKKNIDESFSLAIVYAALGEMEQAFKHLTDAYNEHSGQMIYIKYSWWFHSLHDDPRFQELAKKVGFPEVHPPSKKQ